MFGHHYHCRPWFWLSLGCYSTICLAFGYLDCLAQYGPYYILRLVSSPIRMCLDCTFPSAVPPVEEDRKFNFNLRRRGFSRVRKHRKSCIDLNCTPSGNIGNFPYICKHLGLCSAHIIAEDQETLHVRSELALKRMTCSTRTTAATMTRKLRDTTVSSATFCLTAIFQGTVSLD